MSATEILRSVIDGTYEGDFADLAVDLSAHGTVTTDQVTGAWEKLGIRDSINLPGERP